MLKVVHEESESQLHVPAAVGRSLLDELARNGFHDPREVATTAGAVPVRQTRVNAKRIDEGTGERKRSSSAILPAWARKSPGVAEILPRTALREAFPATEEQRCW